MPFWKRRQTEFVPESLRLTTDQLQATASEAVDGFVNVVLNAFVAEGLTESCDPAEIQAIEGGRAFDRALAVLMNSGAAKYYDDAAQRLWDAGVRDKRYYQVIAQSANEVNALILSKLAARGFDVKRMQESVPKQQ